jgi:ubiquitin C-terminal hydrolase
LKKSEEKKMENSIFPNINHERNELLNVNTLSNDLTKMVEMQCQFTKLFLRDIKSKIDNNNNISTTRVFERNNNKKRENPNNILDNHGKNNNNNNDIKINDNKINEGVTMLMVDKAKSINNNQNIRNKQAENLAQNNNQQIISQNQNNNFNNKNISQNNRNNANNCNNQNKFQNFNNAFQNNMLMYNNQQINQFNQKNAQNNMLQQNNLLINSSPNLHCNNAFQNFQNNNFQQNFNLNNYYMKMMNYFQNLMNNQIFLNNNNFNGIEYPHKSGLENIGQSCYMNATIECLSNIREITDHLLCLNENLISKKNSLTLSYRSLLVELFLTGQKVIVPEIFKSVVGELNPLFQGKHAADSKDLLFFLIEKFHLENNFENKNIPNIQKNFYQLEKESRNEKLMFQNFMIDSKLKANSIFSQTFYGITESIMDCKGCGIRKYSFQSFNMQIFQLKKLKEDKLLKCQNNGRLNLIDAFVLQQMPELLINDNMIYCNNCKGLNNGVHQQFIYELPKVLIIILNRGRNNADFNEGFDFPPILDLRNQNVIINPNSPKLFYLCGVITHLGESGIGGHFIAYCRNNINDNFTFYNDSTVSQASINEAISYKISDNEMEKRTPYILFYHYI